VINDVVEQGRVAEIGEGRVLLGKFFKECGQDGIAGRFVGLFL
jgi:hypothetical protein